MPREQPRRRIRGISVGGIRKTRVWFPNMLASVDHLPHTHDPSRNSFTRGEPEHGGEKFADRPPDLVALHNASMIATVIVEQVADSTGALPSPKGHLMRRREICDRHDILLIFDEVIACHGRLGAPCAAKHFGATPNTIMFAKGGTSGMFRLGGVAARDDISMLFIESAAENAIDLFHGHTYGGHPVAAAAGLATMRLYEGERLLEKVSCEFQEHRCDAVHLLRKHASSADAT